MQTPSAIVTETHQDAPKATRRRLSASEQIAAAKEALVRAQRRQRAQNSRSKIVLGGFVLSWARSNAQAARALLQYMNANPPRAQDMEALADVRAELMRIVRANGGTMPTHHGA